MPGPDPTWWEQYGPIGVVAFLAISALVMAVRHYLVERREERDRIDREKQALQIMVDEQRRSLAQINDRLIEIVQVNHKETLTLLEEQRADHEERYQALLEKHIASSDMAREKTAELAGAVTKAFQSMAKKIHAGGPE
jgi:hypothetical protein